MPDTRKGDFYLGCLEGSVFMDFSKSNDGLVSLCRISFDGYGCCDIAEETKSLNSEISTQFVEEIEKDHLDQKKLTPLIKEAIRVNKEYIWTDALRGYNLLD